MKRWSSTRRTDWPIPNLSTFPPARGYCRGQTSAYFGEVDTERTSWARRSRGRGRAGTHGAYAFRLSSRTARHGEPIRDLGTPAFEITATGVRGSRLSRLKALGRDDNRVALHAKCDCPGADRGGKIRALCCKGFSLRSAPVRPQQQPPG